MKKWIYILNIVGIVLLFSNCDPEARWETSDVKVEIAVETISAAYVECNFSTNKDAYYLIAISPVDSDVNPMEYQKQFMTLALDSANEEYLYWRSILLQEGEFNIAPFASHALQYGNVTHFFTSLTPDTDYWIYAFVVNPEKMIPTSRLFMTTIRTASASKVDVWFEYRVKGIWDYIYPVDSNKNINSHFPYIATTRDSLILAEAQQSPQEYFSEWMLDLMEWPQDDDIYYGVKAIKNDGFSSASMTRFEKGHTYYTAIGGFDGGIGNNVIYKFRWENESTEYYFTDTDSTNLVKTGTW